MSTKEKHVQAQGWVRESVKRTLEEWAEREERRPGNLAGGLIEWGLKQIAIAGSLAELKRLSVVPVEHTAGGRGIKTPVPSDGVTARLAETDGAEGATLRDTRKNRGRRKGLQVFK